MYMERFKYVRASGVFEAVALLNDPQFRSRPLAGSTDLLLQLRHQSDLCDRVVDIGWIPELKRIEQNGSRVVIGAAASFSEVVQSPLVNQTAPLLVQACRLVGAVQIRNMGTLGGNVANAAACADSLPALVCLDADVEIVTVTGCYSMPVSEFIVSPNQTLLPKGGLIRAFNYPIPDPGSRGVFLKLGRRNAMAISRLTAAALGRLDVDGRIEEARFVPGSATPGICRLDAVEKLLVGQFPSPVLMEKAARTAADEVVRLAGRRWSSEFKEPALMALTKRALNQVFGMPEKQGVDE
jgi:CO/xanthine dehydrogenase FAD-binding subunit